MSFPAVWFSDAKSLESGGACWERSSPGPLVDGCDGDWENTIEIIVKGYAGHVWVGGAHRKLKGWSRQSFPGVPIAIGVQSVCTVWRRLVSLRPPRPLR